jgi:DNA-binding beta-propeller fold protein YncE|tara:strand:+ start:198 stop:398 length:201 start_codon:yes stop_codon:yes gene_type:complete
MATVIKLKKSETASSVPTTSNLAVGEVAVNTADQKIYVRDSSDNIVTVANKGEELGTVLAMTVALG